MIRNLLILLLATLSACTSTPYRANISTDQRQAYIKRLESKIDDHTGSNYGHIILKHDLLQLGSNQTKSCSTTSSLYHELNSASKISKKQFARKIRSLERTLKEKATSQTVLLDIAKQNASQKLAQLNQLLAKAPIPSTAKIEHASYSVPKISHSNDVFSVLEPQAPEIRQPNILESLIKTSEYTSSIPLTSPLPSYKITSNFGPRTDPIKKKKAQHAGIDLKGADNSSIYATASGIVSFAGEANQYGNLIIIDHGKGYKTYYGHLDLILVHKNDTINLGQEIGTQGNTGKSTNEHLHYEVRFNGTPIDPKGFLGLAGNCTAN